MKKTIHILTVMLTATMLILAGSPLALAKYPEGPVTIVVGFGTGGNVDSVVRGIRPYVEKYLGTTVLVENKPGNNSLIAANYVGTAKPDGYTLFAGTNGMTLIVQLMPDAWKLGGTLYDAFIPIYSWIHADGNGLFVKKDSPVKTVDDLVKEANKRSIKIAVAGGLSSTDSVTSLAIKNNYGGKWVVIPTDSGAEVVAGVLGGHYDAGIGGPTTAAMDPAKLRMLAVTMKKRSSRWPDTPTFEELGKPQITVNHIVGAMAPLGTAPEIIKTLEEAFKKARHDAGYIEWATKTGQPIGDDGLDAQTFYNSLKDYTNHMQVILPDLQERLRKAQSGK